MCGVAFLMEYFTMAYLRPKGIYVSKGGIKRNFRFNDTDRRDIAKK